MVRHLFALVLVLLIRYHTGLFGQDQLSSVRLNQLGFYPGASKVAIVVGKDFPRPDSLFYLLSAGERLHPDTLFTGILGPVVQSNNSSVKTRMADFSQFKREGIFVIVVPGAEKSYPFQVGRGIFGSLVQASLKGYYYQRSAMPLDAVYAGQWSRPGGHPDTLVLVHPSAASSGRPAGTIISCPGGWYDAGDYNKYIVNSGITMGTLLDAYEDFPAYFDTLHISIPEGGNGLPDILDECLYNLRWMLTMQDPMDGGVYHKCTNAAFDGMVMPGVTKAPRYVVQKGTAATLDFAAVTAQAGRILKKFSARLPGLSDSCLHAAALAWSWALAHPDLAYDDEAMKKVYVPAITTGGYGDKDFRDEWFWAAAELWLTTGNPAYEKVVAERIDDPMRLPSWANVSMMGAYTLLRYRNLLSRKWLDRVKHLQERLLRMANDYVDAVPSSAFHTVMGRTRGDFIWGSNSVAANQGMLLINAWFLTKDRKYLDGALGNLDYLLGRNATGYCFVTGMGSYSPMHPHHRPSIADGVLAPVPGLLVGGPNPGRQDHQYYAFTEPETAYADLSGAYASNEIAINWNAPLVYLAGALEALQYQAGYTISDTIRSGPRYSGN